MYVCEMMQPTSGEYTFIILSIDDKHTNCFDWITIELGIDDNEHKQLYCTITKILHIFAFICARIIENKLDKNFIDHLFIHNDCRTMNRTCYNAFSSH